MKKLISVLYKQVWRTVNRKQNCPRFPPRSTKSLDFTAFPRTSPEVPRQPLSLGHSLMTHKSSSNAKQLRRQMQVVLGFTKFLPPATERNIARNEPKRRFSTMSPRSHLSSTTSGLTTHNSNLGSISLSWPAVSQTTIGFTLELEIITLLILKQFQNVIDNVM